ncbi:MAG: nucleoside phosphorylase [Xanthobacteraceae bacterium]
MTKPPPILSSKHYAERSVFQPAALLREARRQKRLEAIEVPAVCILDPDGDLVRTLAHSGASKRFEGWACYHSRLDTFALGGEPTGIVGCAVGAPFAVLVAEELFASGCQLLISMTSAGQIVAAGSPPYFVIIDRAMRDEGTSYHYAAPDAFAEADPRLIALASKSLKNNGLRAIVGSSWTTDAPFRETASAIAFARNEGVLTVEMEAAALYTFARSAGAAVICIAHVTNTMGLANEDFEKGADDGTVDALKLLEAIVLGVAEWLREFSSRRGSAQKADRI